MSKDSNSQGDESRAAGRGVLFIAVAKLYFMLMGAIIEFRLTAILSKVTFGAYGFVSSLVSPINNVLIVGSIQAVSRFTSQDPQRARAIQNAGLRMHFVVGLPIAITFAAAAPLVAHFFHDEDKVGPLMLASLVIAGYSFYAVLVGRANGTRRFHIQAGLDMGFATMRAVGILGLASAGFGLYGVISGWVLAVVAILLVASFAVGRGGERKPSQPIRPLLLFFAGVATYLILMNLIMVVDQLLLKRISTQWFYAHAAESQAMVKSVVPSWLTEAVGSLKPSDGADGQVGYYRAIQNLARLSYQAILAATFVIFPLVSRSTFVDDEAATHRYVTTTVRYSFMFAMAIGCVFAANPLELLDIPYARDYAVVGAPALSLLAIGNVGFAIFAICGTILNGAGDTRSAIATAVVTLFLAGTANALLIPHFTPGADLLTACAFATAGSMLLGAIVSIWFLHKTTGASVRLKTVLRIVGAGAVTVLLGKIVPNQGALVTMAESVGLGLFFFVALLATGELTSNELRAVAGLVRGKNRQTRD